MTNNWAYFRLQKTAAIRNICKSLKGGGYFFTHRVYAALAATKITLSTPVCHISQKSTTSNATGSLTSLHESYIQR